MENLNLRIGNYSLDLVVSHQGAEHYVALKPLSEALGLEWKRQLKRTQSNPQFSVGVHMYPGSDGKKYEMLCIPVCEVGMWLCTINANKVNAELKPKLLALQRHLQVVIHDHLTGRLTLERLQQLEGLIMTLAQEVQVLREENAELRRRLDNSDTMGQVLVSNAGRHLAAQKKAKAVH